MITLPAPSKTAVPPHMKAAVAARQAKIDAALAQPGATGMKGFLIWVKAAWPAPIADKILAAAKAHLQHANMAVSVSPIASTAMKARAGVGMYDGPTTFGNTTPGAIAAWGRRRRNYMGGLGQTTDIVPSSSVFAPISIAPASTDPTIAATPSSSASSSWLSSIGSAISGAVQGYIGIQNSKDAQTLFDTNLARAQQGLAPLNANPAAYGAINPGINIGLSTGTQSLLMYGAIGAGILGLLYIGVHAMKKG